MKKLIVEHLKVATIYAEDGAMQTALDIVGEAAELLKKEIVRRQSLGLMGKPKRAATSGPRKTRES
jgi:hypothetical protein